MDDVLRSAALVLNGLLAGLYLAFALAVMPALARQPESTYAEVMRAINVAIVGPVFLLLFVGAPASAVGVAVVERSWPLVLAAVLAMGALVLTFAVHLPLNEALEKGGPASAFAERWVPWHVVRTVLATGSFVGLVLGG